jgi:hypothetical protein
MATRVTPRAGSASLHWHGSRHGQPSVIADVRQNMRGLDFGMIADIVPCSLSCRRQPDNSHCGIGRVRLDDLSVDQPN